MAWRDLIAIAEEAAQDRATEASTPPEACPNDGTPLETSLSGVLYCPFDGWRADGSVTGAG